MKINTKDKIIDVTIKLLKKEKEVTKVSMRKIASEADIAVSVINYHFQTKQNLINKAVDQYINQVISESSNISDFNELTIEEQIRVRIKDATNFIANNPGVSRVSVLNDLNNPNINDNSSKLFQSILKQLEEYYQDRLDEVQLKILVQQQIATVQEIFLRHEIFKEQTGLDFYDEKDRQQIVDTLIDQILRKGY
jgi:AcrR family transcriptional regulator